MYRHNRFPLPGLALLFFFSAFSEAAMGQTSTENQPADTGKARLLREVEELKQKIANNQSDAPAYYKLGDLYQSLSSWQEAASAYEHATQAAERFAAAYYALGWCYGNMAKHEDALKAHQQALLYADAENSKPNKAAAQYALGWDYYALKRYPEALEAYQQSLKLNSKYQVARYEMGRIQIALEQRDQALATAQQLDGQFRQYLLKELELSVPVPALAPPPENKATGQPPPVSQTLRPVITYREKARYTEIARQNKIHGVVVLNVIFAPDGVLRRVRILRALPFGLTAQALLALEKIRFEPAVKDGQPVAVRGSIEYSFSLY